VSINLRDHFPYPYTLEERAGLDRRCRPQPRPHQTFAIEHAGEAIGELGSSRCWTSLDSPAEVGYWLGEEFWGQGFATEALRCLTRYAFGKPSVRTASKRWSSPPIPSPAECWKKAATSTKAILRRSASRMGDSLDCHLYVRLRPR